VPAPAQTYVPHRADGALWRAEGGAPPGCMRGLDCSPRAAANYEPSGRRLGRTYGSNDAPATMPTGPISLLLSEALERPSCLGHVRLKLRESGSGHPEWLQCPLGIRGQVASSAAVGVHQKNIFIVGCSIVVENAGAILGPRVDRKVHALWRQIDALGAIGFHPVQEQG